MLKIPGIYAKYGKPRSMSTSKVRATPSSKKSYGIKSWSTTLKRIGAYLSAYRKLLIVVVILAVVSSLLSLSIPFLLGVIVDSLVKRNVGDLLELIFLLAGVYVIQTGATLIQNYLMIGAAQKTVAAIRSDLFSHLHKLKIPYFGKKQNGELMSRFTNDMDNVSQTLSSSFIQLFSSIVAFIGMLSFMLWLSPLLTLITLTIVPTMFLGMKWITARTGPLFKEQQRDLGAFNGYIEETLSGQLLVKSFSREQHVLAAFKGKADKLRISSYWAQTYSGFVSKLMILLNNMSFAVIAAAGGLMAFHGLITIGVIVTFAEYARQFVRPLNDLSAQINTMLSAVAGAERVFQMMDEEAEEDEEDAVSLEEVRGELEFANVSFSYEGRPAALSKLNFHVRPGQTVALVGPTGAGKTTVVQLISRFYEIGEGSIRIDGHDIRRLKRSSLRRHMGFVLQDSILFEASIRENIRYGRLDATDEEVEQAAKLANAHAFIMNLPQQYETHLHQSGGGVSHGQKQLLAIARAILADPSILILDEATSSIDTVTEFHIQEALQRLMKNRTNVVIAHRLNTIRQADLILVLDNGRIMEKGTHDELLRHNGLYTAMHQVTALSETD